MNIDRISYALHLVMCGIALGAALMTREAHAVAIAAFAGNCALLHWRLANGR